MRPSGWRPTAFYRLDRTATAWTQTAELDEKGGPKARVESPVDELGLVLDGPWELQSYDPKWGFASYRRPDGYEETGGFRAAPRSS